MPTVSLTEYQLAVLHNPFNHFAFFAGVAGGKTYTGSHFAIKMVREHPECTGFIGANNYDQLSQATLRELFYWLEEYGFEFIVDRRPPLSWEAKRRLKDYNNTIHVRNPKNGMVTLIFTRVLAKGNPLRGLEFTWYWLDETRDTPEITHDIVISRQRETPGFIKGIITTTTNGEDWTFKRFVRGGGQDLLYGSCHIPTIAAVEAGIITDQYYQSMRRSYSPLMALQELDAKHVNVLGGKAYYSASDKNQRRMAPWGDMVPVRKRPLIVGCDFNFNPAPCVWMVGQIGPSEWSADKSVFYGDCIHWFGEISGVEMSTEMMTYKLMSHFPDFHYRVFGDVTGGRGTTSNAGETDYHIMGNVFSQSGATYSIDFFQSEERSNPKVRNRVENMNAMFCNAVGEVRQTYDPGNCPLFDGDLKMVGWKKTVQSGRGKLDDGGDHERTHATDGAGYAVWRLFPPTYGMQIIESLPSSIRSESGLLHARS